MPAIATTAQPPTGSPPARKSFFAQRPAEAANEAANPPARASAPPLPTPQPKKPAAKKVPAPRAEGDELGRLKRLGFDSLAEVLLSIPKGYFDYTTPLTKLRPEHIDLPQYVILEVTGDPELYDEFRKRTTYWQSAKRVDVPCRLVGGGTITITVFGNLWPWKEVHEGLELHMYGTPTYFAGALKLSKMHFVPPHARGKVIAQYAGKPGQVSGEALGEGVSRAIERLDEAEVLLLAQAGLRESEFTELTGVKRAATLLRVLHFPADVERGRRAAKLARKLAAETVVRRAAAARLRPPVSGSAIAVDKNLVEQLMSELPFPPTADQRNSIYEIVNDLRSAYAMNRLLSGDVGTGKSVVFQVPAVAAYCAGANVAILVPSQLLVDQLANEFEKYFPGLPVTRVVAIPGKKTVIGDGIAIGTTALLSAAKKAKLKFHLVITDEQHKFSVEQKASLNSKFTNVLEATATAIPRTLALVHFGGMDVSVLRECPVKKEIKTRIVTPEMRKTADESIAAVVSRGGQVAVIYPLVDSTGTTSGTTAAKAVTEGLESVVTAARQWEAKFPGRVGVLHGKLDPQEKKAVIDGMGEGKFDILVSSLVIEVGVTLPSLKVIVINHPERFGLAQLHQLRGRVARKGGKGGMFLMVGEDVDEESYERLELLTRCSDGFELAEHDMDMRGFGDVNDDGSSQTGSNRTLFYNSQLSHDEIAETAKRLGVTV